MLLTVILATLLDIIPAPQEARLNGQLTKESDIKSEICLIDETLPEEGYVLEVEPSAIRITAGSQAGIFYARQTLAQERDIYGGYKVGTIKDSPRFAWRGYMLDESRHFFGEEYVKKVLDQMAYFKLNKFHWHLTDAPGWRIEIKKYPLLTTIGATGNYTNPDAAPAFYTQEQIKRIISYAEKLHIEVIPEFDMPGHASAANRAYPENSGGKVPNYPDFTFNVGREETYQFISDIFDELFALFPSKYIHIGGDEVSFGSECWKDDPHVQAMMKREGLKTLKEAERYFLRRIFKMVGDKGRKLIAWDDVMDAGFDVSGATITWWRQERPDHITQALDGGSKAILCPRKPLYLDFVQYEGQDQGRHTWGSDFMACTLEDIYNFPDKNVSGVEFTSGRIQNVLGIQGNLWSETVSNAKRADYMSWPRLCAIAESGWSDPSVKDYKSFEQRMKWAYDYLDGRGVFYFDTREPLRRAEPPVAKAEDWL